MGTDNTGGTGNSGNSGSTGGSIASSSDASIGGNSVDPALLSTGENNAAFTGGYFWTYTDHNPPGSEYHAFIDQVTSKTVALQPVLDDPIHGHAFRIRGSVPAELPWSLVSIQDSSTIDAYWRAFYPDSMIPAYPAAGIGFGFLNRNQPFDATGNGKYIGILFEMKIGVATPTVWVSMPMLGTDLPDPSYGDEFPKQCQYYTAENQPTTGYQTCLAYHRKAFRDASTASKSSGLLGDVGTWNRYCVLYSEMAIPNWANAATRAALPTFDPTKLLKVQWDMYQPKSTVTAVPFDVSLDNVRLITRAQALDPSNNCDPGFVDAPPGSGIDG